MIEIYCEGERERELLQVEARRQKLLSGNPFGWMNIEYKDSVKAIDILLVKVSKHNTKLRTNLPSST